MRVHGRNRRGSNNVEAMEVSGYNPPTGQELQRLIMEATAGLERRLEALAVFGASAIAAPLRDVVTELGHLSRDAAWRAVASDQAKEDLGKSELVLCQLYHLAHRGRPLTEFEEIPNFETAELGNLIADLYRRALEADRVETLLQAENHVSLRAVKGYNELVAILREEVQADRMSRRTLNRLLGKVRSRLDHLEALGAFGPSPE